MSVNPCHKNGLRSHPEAGVAELSAGLGGLLLLLSTTTFLSADSAGSVRARVRREGDSPRDSDVRGGVDGRSGEHRRL